MLLLPLIDTVAPSSRVIRLAKLWSTRASYSARSVAGLASSTGISRGVVSPAARPISPKLLDELPLNGAPQGLPS